MTLVFFTLTFKSTGLHTHTHTHSHTHTHTCVGRLLLKLCHLVLEIGPVEDKGNLQKYNII